MEGVGPVALSSCVGVSRKWNPLRAAKGFTHGRLSMANFESVLGDCHMHSKHDCTMHNNNVFVSAFSSLARSMAWRIISTAVMMAEPNETEANDDLNACFVDVTEAFKLSTASRSEIPLANGSADDVHPRF